MTDLSNAANRGKSKKGPKSLDDAVRSNKDKETTTRYTVDLPDSLHHQFKIRAATEQRSMKDVMIEALQRYLQQD
jgi:hypothetical protein